MSNTRLYAVTLVVSLTQLAAGMLLGWTSATMHKFLNENSSLRITMDEVSWMVSLMKLGTSFGCFVTMFMVDFVGRKVAILFAVLPSLLSCVLVFWSTSISDMYLARFIGGIANGIIFTGGSMYVIEIAPVHVRGSLYVCFVLMDYCGNLLGYVVASFAGALQYFYVATFLSMLQFMMFVWCPETPYYLLRRKRFAAAMDSLIFLRGSTDVAEETNSIMSSIQRDPRKDDTLSAVFELISRSGGRKAIVIGVSMMTIQAFSSSIIFIKYTPMILEKNPDTQLQEIVLAIVYLIACLTCVGLVDRLGRRFLMIVSIVGVAFCSFVLGVYFCMRENNLDVSIWQQVFFVSMLLYIASVSLGLISVPFLIVNEIFPIKAKAACVSFCFCVNFMWSFIMSRVWSYAAFEKNVYSTFWFVSGLNVFSIFFLLFCLPETKNRSFSQIHEDLLGDTKK